ncbi:MAG: hypothetical protein LBC72_02655 [Spirochaetaceae bacterium]|jgi:hypothetical protein|nr:hypothetical protein [Spirochaetaceae bacterium]
MQDLDLGILEVLVTFFLFMPVLRPFVKSLWTIDGIVWFPLIAFLCIAGIFAVYGFRPECLPLLFYCLAANIANSRDLSAHVSRLRNTDFIDRSFASFFVHIFFLTLVIAIALIFLPLDSTKLLAKPVESFQAENTADDAIYTIRIYTESAHNPSAPLVLVAPPLTGSAGVVDTVCANLALRGSLAVTFSRKRFDLPAYKSDGSLFMPSIHQVVRNWKVVTRGRSYRDENRIAAKMENERRADIAFVAQQLRKRWPERPFVVIGYGAGGAAAAALAGDDSFLAGCPQFRGALAVESLLHSAYPSEPFTPRAVDDSFWPLKITGEIENWIFRRLPVKVSEPDAVPRPKRPVRFIISADGGARYAAVYKTAREQAGFVSTMSLPRVGALDWTDVPRKYPVLRFLSGGAGSRAWGGLECAENTAAVFQRFIDEVSRPPPPPPDDAAAADAPAAAAPPALAAPPRPQASVPRPQASVPPPAPAPADEAAAVDAPAPADAAAPDTAAPPPPPPESP